MSKEIVGCPFCGETPTVDRLLGSGQRVACTNARVACTNARCPVAPSVIGATRADAIRRWNTRMAVPDSITATQAARVLARLASAAPSPARQAASRANGRKGGRPSRHQKNSMGNENEQKGQPS